MSPALHRLVESLKRGGTTQLGIGPMSLHCVDAAVEVANEVRRPLILIASRRQVDSARNGGGYVNDWATEGFAHYVRTRDRGGFVALCRDHGGPWQNDHDVRRKLGLEEAMRSAKESFRIDMESGFDLLHLDPSVDIRNGAPSEDDMLERLVELYAYTAEESRRIGVDIAVEVGTEEQTGMGQDLEKFSRLLTEVETFHRAHPSPPPLFAVGQTGTLVKETSNVGTLADPFRQPGLLPAEIQVPKLVDLCRRHGMYLKEHNADYLSDEILTWHPRLGIHAANIAPEFGVGQTRYLLEVCERYNLRQEAERFLGLAHASRKWEKWMRPGSTATDRDRAIIAGHYVFSTPSFLEVMETIRRTCDANGMDLDRSLREALKKMILRIMRCFGLLPAENA